MAADTRRKIVIFGTRGLAQMLRALMDADASREVVAFTVEGRFVAASHFDGLPVYPFEDLATRCPPSSHGIVLAVGQLDRNRLRARIFAEAVARGYEVESFIDSTVRRHPSIEIGRGCLIFDGVSLQPYARIGDNVVIRPLAYIGHHATIESHCFVAPHATILGETRIGSHTFIAAHVTISSRVTVGAHSVITAGTVVTRDVPTRSVESGPR
jgi:sugar O-acyltransferase (sialic acid O-acetyltransferase NeuD family)